MKEYQAKKILDESFLLGEGPYYDPRFKRLSFVDILGKKIHTISEDGTREAIEVSQLVGAAIPVKDSKGFLACMQTGLYLVTKESEKLVYDLKEEYKPYQRSNDAKADPCGRLWFESSTAVDDLPASGNLFCMDNGRVSVKIKNTLIANGMAWSGDHLHFYFSDSPKHAVFVYDYDEATGEISNERVLFTVPEEVGVPDGLTIDSDDNIWLAIWGGNRVECHDGRTGELLARVNVPAKQSSSCCFGGDDMDLLYITSAGVGLEGCDEGGLFCCKVDAKGVAPDYVKL